MSTWLVTMFQPCLAFVDTGATNMGIFFEAHKPAAEFR